MRARGGSDYADREGFERFLEWCFGFAQWMETIGVMDEMRIETDRQVVHTHARTHASVHHVLVHLIFVPLSPPEGRGKRRPGSRNGDAEDPASHI